MGNATQKAILALQVGEGKRKGRLGDMLIDRQTEVANLKLAMREDVKKAEDRRRKDQERRAKAKQENEQRAREEATLPDPMITPQAPGSRVDPVGLAKTATDFAKGIPGGAEVQRRQTADLGPGGQPLPGPDAQGMAAPGTEITTSTGQTQRPFQVGGFRNAGLVQLVLDATGLSDKWGTTTIHETTHVSKDKQTFNQSSDALAAALFQAERKIPGAAEQLIKVGQATGRATGVYGKAMRATAMMKFQAIKAAELTRRPERFRLGTEYAYGQGWSSEVATEYGRAHMEGNMIRAGEIYAEQSGKKYKRAEATYRSSVALGELDTSIKLADLAKKRLDNRTAAIDASMKYSSYNLSNSITRIDRDASAGDITRVLREIVTGKQGAADPQFAAYAGEMLARHSVLLIPTPKKGARATLAGFLGNSPIEGYRMVDAIRTEEALRILIQAKEGTSEYTTREIEDAARFAQSQGIWDVELDPETRELRMGDYFARADTPVSQTAIEFEMLVRQHHAMSKELGIVVGPTPENNRATMPAKLAETTEPTTAAKKRPEVPPLPFEESGAVQALKHYMFRPAEETPPSPGTYDPGQLSPEERMLLEKLKNVPQAIRNKMRATPRSPQSRRILGERGGL